MATASMTLFFIVFVVAPYAAIYAFPRLLAPFALAPIGGERRIPVSELAASALGRQSTVDAGYRESPLVRVEIGDLPGPRVVERSGNTLLFYPEHAEILARRSWSFTRKSQPFVRIRMQIRSNQIVLRARWLTTEPLVFLAFFPSVIYGANVRSESGLALALTAMALIMSGLSIVFAYFPAKGIVDAAESEVRSRIAQLSVAAP